MGETHHVSGEVKKSPSEYSGAVDERQMSMHPVERVYCKVLIMRTHYVSGVMEIERSSKQDEF